MNKSKKGFLALSISVILAACTSTTPPLTATPAAGENQTQLVTETATIPLKIAAQVCEKATEPGIPPEGLPYRPTDVLLIGGETIEEGDFVFDFWLTCSPSEGTSQKDQPTTVEGLGVYGGWYYGGAEVEGSTQEYWGFEADVFPTSGFTGPFYKAKSGFRSGITLSEDEINEYVKSGKPLHFQGKIDSPAGVYGAVLEFKLEPSAEGYVPMDIKVVSLSKD